MIGEIVACSVLGGIKRLARIATTLNLNSIDLDIVSAPRTFQSFEWFGAFLRCADGPFPDLFELERDWQRLGQLIEQPAPY
jgi:hypothetical protein